MTSEPEHNLDDLLNDIKSKYKKSDSSRSHTQMNSNNESQTDDYLNSIKERYKDKSNDIVESESNSDRNYLDNLKSQLKASKKATDSSNQTSNKSNKTTPNAPQADDYLNSIKEQYKKPSSKHSQLDDIKSQLKANKKATDFNSKSNKKTPNASQADDYLNSIKAQYKKPSSTQNSKLDDIKSQLKANKKATDFNSKSNKKTPNPPQADDYLNSIKAQYKKPSSTQNSKLDDIKSQLKQTKSRTNSSQIENIDSFKESYQSKKQWQKNQEKLSYSRNKEEIIRQEQQKQLKQKQLTRQAQTWLAKLDPYSEEGMWFNQLAESYPSRLDAAISYLSTLNQSDF